MEAELQYAELVTQLTPEVALGLELFLLCTPPLDLSLPT
jgi:hypothetical protein